MHTHLINLGRHCCLWCDVNADRLKEPRASRKKPTKPTDTINQRSLQGIKDDHKRFLDDGGNLKNAKLFNNVICPNFFDIELEQV